jgi:hypothetical protein
MFILFCHDYILMIVQLVWEGGKECQTKDLGSILAHGDYNYGLGEPVGDTSTSAIDMIRSFDPSSFGAVSLISIVPMHRKL